MKKLLLIMLCVLSLNSVPTFQFTGTSYIKDGVEYINTSKETILDNIFNFFSKDKTKKIYYNADLV